MLKHLILLLAVATAAIAEQHTLVSTPKTVHWGYYAAARTPALRVRSGDTVEIRTAMIDTPEELEHAGLAPDQIDAASPHIHNVLKDRGPRPPVLTGPVYVEG